MNLENLRDALATKPFRPFRLFVTDGASYEVRHPDLCLTGPRTVIIGMPPPGSAQPELDRFAIVDPLHITRLEPLDAPAAK